MERFTFALVLFCSLCFFESRAQNTHDDRKSIITKNLVSQVELFPQEKIHLHIDRPSCLSGERIWLKAYLVNATENALSPMSNYVYVELLDPLKNIISRIKIKRTDESFAGHIDMPEETIEGSYILRAYTNYMKSLDEAYYFQTSIYVNDPLSTKINIVPTFKHFDKNKVEVDILLSSVDGSELPATDKLTYTFNTDRTKDRKIIDSKTVLSLNFDNKRTEQILLIQYDKYKKYLPVPYSPNDFEISFFPEGGNLLDGITNCIAFKSLDGGGQAIAVEGTIVDEAGEKVATLKTTHQGMGSFFIKPESGKTYYALCQNENGEEKRFPLPIATAGYGLQVNWVDKMLHLTVSQSPSSSPQDLYMAMHTNGKLHYVEQWDRSKEKISFAEQMLPSGVLHIMLVNGAGQILSERLAFCQNENDLAIVNGREHSTYITRGYIPIELDIRDNNKKPLKTNLSVSVTDDRDVDATLHQSILSTLLLTSDIKGKIVNPNYYFEDRKRETNVHLDLVMLTHGWRRYNMSKVMLGAFEEPNEAIEVGQEISGQVRSLAFKRPTAGGQVSIFSVQNDYFNITETDEEGRFSFKHFEFPDSINYVLHAYSSKISNNVQITVDKDTFPSINYLNLPYLPTEYKDESFVEYIEKANMKYTLENGIRMIYLPQVEVGAKKIDTDRSPYSYSANYRFTEDFIKEIDATRISDVLRYVAGFYETGGVIYNFRSRRMQGDIQSIAIYIDGTYMESSMFSRNGGPDRQSLSLVAPNDKPAVLIDKVDDFIPMDMIKEILVFKDAASTAILGPNAAHGAVMIITKDGSGLKTKTEIYNIAKASPLGYQKPAEFYSPRYETAALKADANQDLRTTIYWNPSLTSGEDGKVVFDFYAADKATEYSILVEGVSADGQLVRYVERISIE